MAQTVTLAETDPKAESAIGLQSEPMESHSELLPRENDAGIENQDGPQGSHEEQEAPVDPPKEDLVSLKTKAEHTVSVTELKGTEAAQPKEVAAAEVLEVKGEPLVPVFESI